MTRAALPYVLITGASSGIGSEFARYYAGQGYNLILHGRNKEVLEKLATSLAQQHQIETEILLANLTKPDQVSLLIERLGQTRMPVEILINNAGFGLGKAFEEATVQEHADQVEVLAKVPLLLMRVASEEMLKRGRGRIINVASVAAFMPNGTYSAVKRFLVTASESAHLQYRRRGLSITAVCPGLTRSNFHTAMGVSEPKLPSIFWLEPRKVVQEAVAANLAGQAVCVPSITYKILVAAQKIMPRWLATALVARTRNY